MNDPIPCSAEAEESVLGALLVDPQAVVRLAAFLRPGDFYIQKNAWLYQAILDLHERREPLDLVTLRNEMEARGLLEEIGGVAYLAQLMEAVPTAMHAEAYGHIVEEAAVRRRLIRAAEEIAQLAYRRDVELEETMAQTEQIVFGVTQRRWVREATPIGVAVKGYLQSLCEDSLLGVPTGFPDLDEVLGGLQPSDLVIVAARPSVGKSSLALAFARHAAESGRRVVIFSLEMTCKQLLDRFVTAKTGIELQQLRQGRVRGREAEVEQAIGQIGKLDIVIDDTPALPIWQLCARARRLYAERKLDLVVVDYLQLISSGIKAENRNQEIGHITQRLKALARELDVPVVAVSQLSRAVEQRQDKIPVLADLRDSGSIEEHADVVLFLYRDELYHPATERQSIVDVIVAKQRNGPVGKIGLFFCKQTASFESLSPLPQPYSLNL